MNKHIEFFIYNNCIDLKKKNHKNKMNEHLKSLTHKWLGMP